MKRFLLVCFIACLLLTTVGCNENLEEKMESEDNITFGSLEEMKTYLNGKWYRGEYHITTYIYEEIIFHNEEIKSCRVRSYRDKDNSYIKDENYSFEKNFKDYDDDTTPEFNYEKGQIYIGKRDSSCNINVKDGYLKIDRQVYYKATDNTNISYENFETFQNFCEFVSSLTEGMTRWADMYGWKEIEDGEIKTVDPDLDDTFEYMGCDDQNISFEIVQRSAVNSHYFAQASFFKELYEEVKDLGTYENTKILSLYGIDMTKFDKKSGLKDRFYELKYYLSMNADGKLITNIP